jgi:hypothetical protein
LQLETEATLRERRAGELHLPITAIIGVVAAVSLLVLVGYGARQFWVARQHRAAVKPTLPHADFEPYYQPKKPIPAETLEPVGK